MKAPQLPPSSFDTIEDAKVYEYEVERLFSANTMNSIRARFGLFRSLELIATTDGHPVQDAILALIDPKSESFNFMKSDLTGQAQIALLDTLIGANITQEVGTGNIVDVSANLANAKPYLVGASNILTKPYEFITKHKFELDKRTIKRSPITVTNGVARLIVAEEVEAHAPQIYELLNGEHYRRIAGFEVVKEARTYTTECPQRTNLFVDNAYGIV